MDRRIPEAIDVGPVSILADDMVYSSYQDIESMLLESDEVIVIELGPALSLFLANMRVGGYDISDNDGRIMFAITIEVYLTQATMERDGLLPTDAHQWHVYDTLWEELEYAAYTEYLMNVIISDQLMETISQSIYADEVTGYIIDRTVVGSGVRPFKWSWCGGSTILHAAIA